MIIAGVDAAAVSDPGSDPGSSAGDVAYIAARSESRILAACPDVVDCTVVSASSAVDDRAVTDVFLTLRPDADHDENRFPAVRAALGEAVAPTLRRVVTVTGDELVIGAGAEVDKALMQRRHQDEVAGRRLPGLGPGAEPVPVAAGRVPVDFVGEGAGVDEMSWGQREIWTTMISQRNWLPLGGRKPLPAGTTLGDVADELRYLMSRFPTMRTRLRFDDGRARQEVFGSGRITLEVYDAETVYDAEADDDDATDEADDLAAAVEARYRHAPLDFAADWPVRMAVVRRRGAPAHMVAVMCHLVTDGAGSDVMIRQVEQRETAPVAGLQPLAQARWQRSPAGRRQSDGALQHFEKILRVAPVHRPPDPAGGLRPRRWTGQFDSPALRLALPAISRRTGVQSSPVLLALFAVALARTTGVNPAVFRPMVSNRFRPTLADVVCEAAQNGILALDVADVTVDEVVGRARRAVMGAYKNAYFDPEQLASLIARITRERGVAPDVPHFFNDRRSEQTDTPQDAPQDAPPSREALHEARLGGVFRWTGKTDDPLDGMFVAVDDIPDAVRITIEADTHRFSPEDIEALSRCVEAVAIEAALDPRAPATW